MKRVLYITNIPSPYRVEFFNELSRYCSLTVAFEMASAKDRNREWKSPETYRFHSVFMKNVYEKTDGAFCPEVSSLIRRHKRGVVVVGGYSTPTGMYSILYMKLHHIPFLLNCDGGFIKSDNAIKKSVKSFFISSADGWLSTGKACDRYLVHYGADRGRIYHYPFTSIKKADIIKEKPVVCGQDGKHDICGQDDKSIICGRDEKLIIRRQLGIEEARMVLFVGSFIHRKGVDVLLKACRDLEDTAVVLVGGENLSPYKEIIKEGMKSRVYAAGFKNKDEVRQYYQAADVFVLPTREDIWGLVVNEAMACGLPVITTTKCVAGLELVREGVNGYLVKPEDVPALRDRIGKILEDGMLRERMSEGSRKIIGKYTIENMAKEHAFCFNKFYNGERK